MQRLVQRTWAVFFCLGGTALLIGWVKNKQAK